MVAGGSTESARVGSRFSMPTPADDGVAAGANRPSITVVTVAFGADPWLESSVASCLGSTSADVDVVVVDNGCTDGAVARLAEVERVTVLRPGRNLGFAEGSDLGVSEAAGEIVALVNPDARVEPPALGRLARVAMRSDVGIATGSLRLAERPDRLNAAGTDIHFLGMSWCRAFEEDARLHGDQCDVAGASGAFLVMRRSLWSELHGFDPEFFAYLEDADLSLRVWQAGYRVVFVPDAVAVHRYEFSRNPRKFFLADRNRMIMVLTLMQGRSLLLLAPALVVQELALVVEAAVHGWLPQRLGAIRWMLTHPRWLLARRARIGAQREVPDSALAGIFGEVVQPGNYPLPRWAVTLQWPLRLYWRLVRRLL